MQCKEFMHHLQQTDKCNKQCRWSYMLTSLLVFFTLICFPIYDVVQCVVSFLAFPLLCLSHLRIHLYNCFTSPWLRTDISSQYSNLKKKRKSNLVIKSTVDEKNITKGSIPLKKKRNFMKRFHKTVTPPPRTAFVKSLFRSLAVFLHTCTGCFFELVPP